MSNTPIVYSSTDASAPQLTGQVGSLVALLDALLVNGYGSKSACGWTKPSGSTSTLAAYCNSVTTGSGMCFQCKDNADGTGGAKEAQIRGYEAMSNASTGTLPFPSVAQLSTGNIWSKSATADGTARAWWAMGCERWLYLFVDTYGAGLGLAAPYFVGDTVSLLPADGAPFLIAGSALSNQSSTNRRGTIGDSVTPITAPSSSNAVGWIARNYAGIPGGVRLAASANSFGDTTWGGNGVDSYPFVVNNGLIFERGYLHEGVRRPRCRLPCFYIPLHPSGSFSDLQSLPSVPGLPSGTDFVAKRARAGGASFNFVEVTFLLDVTNPE